MKQTIQLIQLGYPADPTNTIERVIINGGHYHNCVRFDGRYYRVHDSKQHGPWIDIDRRANPKSQAIGGLTIIGGIA